MASASAAIEQRNQDATLWVGGLDDRVDDDLVWELFVQAGPLVSVHMPLDKVSGRHGGYAFVEFRTEGDADYAMKSLNTVKLFGKSVNVRKAGDNKQQQVEVGANLFIGNLAPEVDDTTLYSTFGAFGTITHTRVTRDVDSGESKGFGFVYFDSFESSDVAIQAMNGQYLASRPIVVQYAFRKDRAGERHGSQAERLLASAMRGGAGAARPHTLFAAVPGQTMSSAPAGVLMLGEVDRNAPPPMLPPTAILPASMLVPPSHAGSAGMPTSGGMTGMGVGMMGMGMGMMGGMHMPPPVPMYGGGGGMGGGPPPVPSYPLPGMGMGGGVGRGHSGPGMGRGIDMTRPAWMTAGQVPGGMPPPVPQVSGQ